MRPRASLHLVLTSSQPTSKVGSALSWNGVGAAPTMSGVIQLHLNKSAIILRGGEHGRRFLLFGHAQPQRTPSGIYTVGWRRCHGVTSGVFFASDGLGAHAGMPDDWDPPGITSPFATGTIYAAPNTEACASLTILAVSGTSISSVRA